MRIPTQRFWFNFLQLGLAVSAAGWGIAFFFTFASWELATGQMVEMGAGLIAHDPLMDYWLRMASAGFGCIGIASGIAAWRPAKFEGLVQLLGPFHVFMAIVLATSAKLNGLTPSQHVTFIPDICFCTLTAVMILLSLYKGAKERH